MDALTKSLELTQKPKTKKATPKKTTSKEEGCMMADLFDEKNISPMLSE